MFLFHWSQGLLLIQYLTIQARTPQPKENVAAFIEIQRGGAPVSVAGLALSHGYGWPAILCVAEQKEWSPPGIRLADGLIASARPFPPWAPRCSELVHVLAARARLRADRERPIERAAGAHFVLAFEAFVDRFVARNCT